MPRYRVTFVVEYDSTNPNEAFDEAWAMQAAVEDSMPGAKALWKDQLVEALDTAPKDETT